MNLKLTPQNAEALFNLFNDFVLLGNTTSLYEKLLQAHMVSIYKKFRNQWEGTPRKTYNLKVTETEALAYWLYWQDVDMSNLTYEFSFITNHVLQIDRELNTQKYNEISNIKLLK